MTDHNGNVFFVFLLDFQAALVAEKEIQGCRFGVGSHRHKVVKITGEKDIRRAIHEKQWRSHLT